MKDFLDELDNELDGMTLTSEDKTPKKSFPASNQLIQKKHIPADTPAPVSSPQQKQPPRNTTQNTQNKNQGRTQNRNNQRRNTQGNDGPAMREDKLIQFPEIKFFLPTLRDGYTRFIPIGGNNETGGKNMGLLQYQDDLLLID